MYLSCSLNSTINSSYFRNVILVGLQYEPASLNVNEVCFDGKQNIPNMREKSRKNQSVTEC